MTLRQERQIVQSELNLDDFLPGFTPSVGLTVQREVTKAVLGAWGWPPEAHRHGEGRSADSVLCFPTVGRQDRADMALTQPRFGGGNNGTDAMSPSIPIDKWRAGDIRPSGFQLSRPSG